MATIDEEAYRGMNPSRTYVSKSFLGYDHTGTLRPLRYVSKVIDSDIVDRCEVEAGEIIIRQTDGGRQQIKALFYEDDRSIETITIQRFYADGTNPSQKQYFSFKGEEIRKLFHLLELTQVALLSNSDKARFDDYVDEMLGEDAALLRFVQRHRARLGQLEDAGSISQYLEFCERNRQIEIFGALLHDSTFFEQMRQEWGCRGHEAVWQRFFERNPWIFGLSLAPVFLSSLEGKKLEQVVRGFSVAGEGKRADALMRTNGILGSLCFVEIKTHVTPLLQPNPKAYRPGAWRISDDVAGAVTQCHTTVQDAMNDIRTKLIPYGEDGNPTGEEYFLYQPRSYLVVGCLDQFKVNELTNEIKFRSFELYRRNFRSPEIITFDELLERARAIVDCNPNKSG